MGVAVANQKIEYDEIENFRVSTFHAGRYRRINSHSSYVKYYTLPILTAVLRSQSGERCEIFFLRFVPSYDIEPSGRYKPVLSFEKQSPFAAVSIRIPVTRFAWSIFIRRTISIAEIA